MKKIISILLIFLLTACTIELSSTNEDIMDAQEVQTIYFELIQNPDYYTNIPESWSIYEPENIQRAKELYSQKISREENEQESQTK